MGNHKRKIANTEQDNLISNLRGEVGEIITAWVVMRQYMALGAKLLSWFTLKWNSRPSELHLFAAGFGEGVSPLRGEDLSL